MFLMKKILDTTFLIKIFLIFLIKNVRYNIFDKDNTFF
jgi:hypothetical protein